ncbi:MAG TPA: translation elongation factor Ts [Vicinamibacterales bacterium]|jgi:elongation factor Ts
MATTITAAEVKKLRDATGAGMMDCKSALEEARGNLDEATTILRKKGLASAAKKAGRATADGLIAHRVSADHHSGVLVEVNCETDFVARTDDFQQLMADVIGLIEQAGDKATDEWLKDPNGPVQQRVAVTIGKVGENMAVSRFARYAGSNYVDQYIHPPGKIGVMVEIAGATPEIAGRAEFTTLVKDLMLQIAAASPTYASREAVPADALEKEKAIYRAQMENSGKPANVIDKIVEGKLGAFYEQIVLVDQMFIRVETKQKVSDVIAGANKALGARLSVVRFARLKVGEASA